MGEIISVACDGFKVKMQDGSIVEISVFNANFVPKVGAKVEVHKGLGGLAAKLVK